jgi:hypothetical protein
MKFFVLLCSTHLLGQSYIFIIISAQFFLGLKGNGSCYALVADEDALRVYYLSEEPLVIVAKVEKINDDDAIKARIFCCALADAYKHGHQHH